MRHPNFPGVAKRIRERLLALDWVDQETGAPDIAGFIKAKHYDPRSFYPWVRLEKERTPSGENLARLCRDLECSPGWLLFGVEMATPIGGGSGADAALESVYITLAHRLTSCIYWQNGLLLLRRRFASWLWNCTLSPQAA